MKCCHPKNEDREKKGPAGDEHTLRSACARSSGCSNLLLVPYYSSSLSPAGSLTELLHQISSASFPPRIPSTPFSYEKKTPSFSAYPSLSSFRLPVATQHISHLLCAINTMYTYTCTEQHRHINFRTESLPRLVRSSNNNPNTLTSPGQERLSSFSSPSITSVVNLFTSQNCYRLDLSRHPIRSPPPRVSLASYRAFRALLSFLFSFVPRG